jgi:hypothetical protein
MNPVTPSYPFYTGGDGHMENVKLNPEAQRFIARICVQAVRRAIKNGTYKGPQINQKGGDEKPWTSSQPSSS